MRFLDFFFDHLVLTVTSVLLFAGIGVVACQEYELDSTCAKAGYPNSKMTWNLDKYCVKRVDQTDVIIPVSEVVRENP